MKTSETQNCQWCNNDRENYHHFFYECQTVKKLWKEVCKHLKLPIEIQNVDYDSFIPSHLHQNCKNSYNLISLIFKQKLYATKCKKQQPNKQEIVNEITFIQRLKQRQIESQKSAKCYAKRWNLEMKQSDESEQEFMQYYLQNVM